MQTVNMHEAKTQLSKLVAKAAAGEPFIIAKAGKPMVKVVAVDAPEPKPKRRFGFLQGLITVPSIEEWQEMDKEIEAMFYGENE